MNVYDSPFDEEFLSALPVRVEHVNFNDPMINLWGENWAMLISGPWEAVIHGENLDWGDSDRGKDVVPIINSLLGETLIDAYEDGRSVVFVFSDSLIRVYPDPDDEGWESWTLRLPTGFGVDLWPYRDPEHPVAETREQERET